MIPRTRERRPPNDLSHLYPEGARPELHHARRLACCSGSWRDGTKSLRYMRVHVLALIPDDTIACVWRYVTLRPGESGSVRYATFATRAEAARALETFDGCAGAPPDVQAAYASTLVGELLHALRANAAGHTALEGHG